jgi:hypothetical protein
MIGSPPVLPPLALARATAAATWECPVDAVDVEDLTETYSWRRKEAIIAAYGPRRFQDRMIVALHGEEALVFDHSPRAHADDAARLARANRFLALERLDLPYGVPLVGLSKAIREFLRGFGGFVGSRRFLERQTRGLGFWLKPETPAALFERHCKDPAVTRDTDGHWRLAFFYFTNRGGVESWSASGIALKIQEWTCGPALPDGTFNFPYA